jgi:cob(I)alamin adenosyltransferase
MKIYTKTGDNGTTGLYNGKRVPKNHVLIEAIGTVDELNALLGAVLAGLNKTDHKLIADIINTLQEQLFIIGSELANPSERRDAVYNVSTEQVSQLERWLDDITNQLPPLKYFIIPGGSATSSKLHVARTVCRRAERRLVAAAEQIKINKHILIYLNRLADLLFQLARLANQQSNIPDKLWKKN